MVQAHCSKDREPRPYTPRDVTRIVKIVEKKHGAVTVFLAVLAGLGLTYEVCNFAKMTSKSLSLMVLIGRASFVVSFSIFVQYMIQWLARGALIKIPVFNRIVIFIILALTLLDNLLGYAIEVAKTYEDSKQFIFLIAAACTSIGEVVKTQQEEMKDLLSQIGDSIDDLDIAPLNWIDNYIRR